MPAHVIAFDLDMTLVDSRDAIAGALDLLSVDHRRDMVAARLAGAVAVGVTTGAASAEELWAAGADMVVASLEDAESKALDGRDGSPVSLES